MTNNWGGAYQPVALLPSNGGDFITFPCEEISITWKQRVAHHPKPNVPGAKIESLAPDPHTFHIKAIFVNGLLVSPGETWSGGDLFPGTFVTVFNLLNDPINNVFTFTHPTLGNFNVKSVGGHSVTTHDCKNGQMMEFDLVQANLDTQDTTTTLSTRGLGSQSAMAFDNIKFNPPLKTPNHFITLTDLFNSVLSVITTTTLELQRLTFVVNNAKFMIYRLQSALDAFNDAKTALATMHLQNVLSAIEDIDNNKKVGQLQIKSFTVPNNMTVGQIASLLNNSIDSLVQLNPSISYQITIPQGTKIFYTLITKYQL